MFEQMKEKIKIFLVASIFCTCLANIAAAQTFTAQNAATFARSHGGEAFADVLDSIEGRVICGNEETICSNEEFCLKCRFEYYDNLLGFSRKSDTTEQGKCVSRQGFDENNLIKYWPSCKSVDVGIGISKGNSTGIRRTLTLERSGFINQSSGNFLFIKWRKDPQEFTDSAGRKYSLYVEEGNTTIVYAGNKSYEGCEVLPVKVYNLRGCFFCPLARLIFGTGNKMTAASFEMLAASLKVVIVVVFCIWLALAILQQVSTFTKQDAPKLLAAIVKQAFKFSIAFLLLSYPNEIFSKFMLPVLNSGIKMGTSIMEPVKILTSEESEALINRSSSSASAYSLKNSAMMGDSYYNLRPGGQNSAEPTFYERLENYLSTLQTKLAYMQAIGTTLVCVGSDEIIDISWKAIKEGFRMMILGVIIVVFSFLLTISFAFMFLDTILELALIGAMLPLMIAGWPFKVTAQYASTGLKMLLNVFFVMFFLGFTISINYNLIDQSLNISQEIVNSSAVASKTQYAIGGFDAIVKAINEQNIEKLREATDIGGIGFLLLAFSCLFGWKVIQQTTSLAGKMSQGFDAKISPNIGTMAASTIKGGVSKLTSPVGNVASDMYHDAGGIVGIVSAPIAVVGETIDAAGRGASRSGRTVLGKTLSVVGKIVKAPHNISKKVHKTYKNSKKTK